MHKHLVFAALLLAISVSGAVTTAPPSLEKRFVSANWQSVYQAEFQLESGGNASLPILISLLDREDVVPLTDTADLIYPGAKTFYGHGWLIDYDLDRVSTRAGWALEELTFENFGFSEGQIREADLLSAVRAGKQDTSLSDVVGKQPSTEVRETRRKAAVARAKARFRSSGATWSRFEALKSALRSDDSFRQLNR